MSGQLGAMMLLRKRMKRFCLNVLTNKLTTKKMSIKSSNNNLLDLEGVMDKIKENHSSSQNFN